MLCERRDFSIQLEMVHLIHSTWECGEWSLRTMKQLVICKKP